MAPIADTGWLVAFWNARDVHHHWARGIEITAPPLVCEAVLTVDQRDFSIYRTLSGKPVNCHFPPA